MPTGFDGLAQLTAHANNADHFLDALIERLLPVLNEHGFFERDATMQQYFGENEQRDKFVARFVRMLVPR